MKTDFLALAVLSGLGLAIPAAAGAQSASSSAPSPPTPSPYVATVDPTAFRAVPREEKKQGVTVSPASVRLITPGVDKFSIYPLLGPPHFGEGVSRLWHYVLFFPATPGSAERVRCRMAIRFTRPPGHYYVAVSEVVWQAQSCADRVAVAN
jgi:outer membrane protein assembly factor BamE (lipoprotein component of BamABCDE complex)